MTNTSNLCKTCRKPKANFSCGLCEEPICKSCTQFLTEGSFSFLRKIPQELTHSSYCTSCFDEKVSAPLAEYEEIMDRAKEVMVFSKDQAKMTGHLKRKEDPFSVENVEDEQEAIMRLAFFAAQDNFNCLLDVQIKNKKIIVGSHKKTIFNATAIPITIDPKAVREQH
jgi:hypothetical protein